MSSPEPAETAPRPSKSKNKDKSKKKSKPQPVIVTSSGKNEGQNPHWAYEPPSGSVLFDASFEGETFDWDSIKKDDDLELWLIRVPDSVGVRQKCMTLSELHLHRMLSQRSNPTTSTEWRSMRPGPPHGAVKSVALREKALSTIYGRWVTMIRSLQRN